MPAAPPNDVVVLGAPRSGTSLAAQLLVQAGLQPPPCVLPATPDNPRGFVEDPRVNAANDELLRPWVGDDPDALRLAWLAALPAEAEVRASAEQEAAMAALLPPAPGCLKDPRFTATFDAWAPVLRPGTRAVAVVRHPAEVAASLAAMAERDPAYFGGRTISPAEGVAVWCAMNERVLRGARAGRWVVVRHEDLLDGTALPVLSAAAGTPVGGRGVDRGLRRSAPDPDRPLPPAAADLHAALAAEARQAREAAGA